MPPREVYTIIPNRKDPTKSHFLRIGSAFVNKDGSENIYLEAMPLDGKLQLRDPKTVGNGDHTAA